MEIEDTSKRQYKIFLTNNSDFVDLIVDFLTFYYRLRILILKFVNLYH
jgi:predicted nuclease of predicted toxin-antitoxin system